MDQIVGRASQTKIELLYFVTVAISAERDCVEHTGDSVRLEHVRKIEFIEIFGSY